MSDRCSASRVMSCAATIGMNEEKPGQRVRWMGWRVGLRLGFKLDASMAQCERII